MFHLKCLFYSILIQINIVMPQVNLHYTDWISENVNKLEHDCLRVVPYLKDNDNVHEIISYCLSSEFNIEDNNVFSKVTFVELSKENISSQQLYLWSAPIDLIENYQFYLNQLSIFNYSSLEKQIYYNCTLLRFGPKCQYEFDYFSRNYSKL